jgi:hypothetical protein
MKKNILTLAAIAALAWTSCGKKTEKTPEVTTPAKDTVILVQPEQSKPAPVRAQKETNPDGTEINVDNTGVKIEDKKGGSETNVEIRKDSSSIRIKRPK